MTKPTWSSYSEVPAVVFHTGNLGRTVPIALVTGLVLFMINQLDVVIRDPGSVSAWVKSGLTFLVPFCVSNLGVLVASRDQATEPVSPSPTGGPDADEPIAKGAW